MSSLSRVRKDRGLGKCLNQTVVVEPTGIFWTDECGGLCWPELHQLLQAQGYFSQRGYAIECRISFPGVC